MELAMPGLTQAGPAQDAVGAYRWARHLHAVPQVQGMEKGEGQSRTGEGQV